MKNKNITRKTASKDGKQAAQRMSRVDAVPPISKIDTLPEPFSYQELRAISIQISSKWFQAPKQTHLALMEVNPWRLHAYWNIVETDMDVARESLSDDSATLPLILRFTDLTSQHGKSIPTQHFDIEVHGLRNNWYVDLWQDGRRYSAQLGLRTPDDGFLPLACSNEIALPRASLSSELDFKQIEVRTPLPLELDAPDIDSDHRDDLLHYLLPGQQATNEAFPEFALEAPNVEFEETEYPGVRNVAEMLANSQVPLQFEQEVTHAETTPQLPAQSMGSEFPQIEEDEIDPYSVSARQEMARLLGEMGVELPPVAEETISPTDVDLTPQPLPFVTESVPNESSRESSKPTADIKSVESGVEHPNPLPDFLQNGFPEIAPDTDTKSTDLEILLTPDEPRIWQADSTPVGLPHDEILPDAILADQSTDTAVSMPGHTTVASGPAPRPVIALEEVLNNAHFSTGRGESGLEITAELHLYGKLASDNVLSLLGERVDMDEQGNFSVRLKLAGGSELSTLLYALRQRTEGHD